MYKAIVKILGKFPVPTAWTYRKEPGFLWIMEMIPWVCGKISSKWCSKAPRWVQAQRDCDQLYGQTTDFACRSRTELFYFDGAYGGSSHAGLFASLSAGINALWGPLHGGANQAVIEMLEAIKADGGDTKNTWPKLRTRRSFRLMGFGHRVYKISTHVQKIIKKAADESSFWFRRKWRGLDIAKG